LHAPWPEELNRRVTTLATRFHFAPTQTSKANLLREGIAEDQIHITGNTVIDALLATVRKTREPERHREFAEMFRFIDADKRLVLVTGHRRENFGAGFENICNALNDLTVAHDVQIVYPVHPNPSVREPVERL